LYEKIKVCVKETLKGIIRRISWKLWIYKSYFRCIFVTN